MDYAPLFSLYYCRCERFHETMVDILSWFFQQLIYIHVVESFKLFGTNLNFKLAWRAIHVIRVNPKFENKDQFKNIIRL